MIAIPAIDLREGNCVQLVGGDYAAERVRLPDPLAVARRWLDAGFTRLHVVDLDAATSRGDNWPAVERLAGLPATVQVGGGVSAVDRVDRALAAGAAHVVVGTRAIRDGRWLEQVACRHPARVIVAADVRGREVLARGWAEATGLELASVLAGLEEMPLGGVLVTAVHQEGRLAGPDLDLVAEACRTTRHPVLASGGIGGVADLRALERAGAAGAVIGMALYVGGLDASAVAKEFAQ